METHDKHFTPILAGMGTCMKKYTQGLPMSLPRHRMDLDQAGRTPGNNRNGEGILQEWWESVKFWFEGSQNVWLRNKMILLMQWNTCTTTVSHLSTCYFPSTSALDALDCALNSSNIFTISCCP